MNNLNNFKDVKQHLKSHTTTTRLSWEENKQKASIKILDYINDLVNQFKIDQKNDKKEIKTTKSEKIQKIKNTVLYVLDTLQKSLNQGNSPNFIKFDNIVDNIKKTLDKQLYLNLTGESSIPNGYVDTNDMIIKSLSTKKSKTLLKNLKIIVTHKNTDGFWNNSNTKTNWFGKDKYNNQTKTHKDFIEIFKNKPAFKNLSRISNYIGGVDGKYASGFGVLDLLKEEKNNYARIKGKFDKHGIPISGQIKSHDGNGSLIKNNIEFYKNPKDDKYYFKRTIKQDNGSLKIYLFRTNDFYKDLSLITGNLDELQNIESTTPVFIGKRTTTGYSGQLQLGEKCLIADFDNNFQITKLKEFGLRSNQSEAQVTHIVNDSKQEEIIKNYTLNNLYRISQSTLFSSEDLSRIFDKLKNTKQYINNQHIEQKISDNCISDYIGETSNKKPHGFGIINWSDSKHIFIGEFKDGYPINGIIIKDENVFHIEYTYNDRNEITTTVEKNIDEYSLNAFIENIYKKHYNFINNIYKKHYNFINKIFNLELNSLIHIYDTKYQKLLDDRNNINNQICALTQRLDENSKKFFKQLLTIENIEKTTIASTIVLGDADGSIGRVILAGIQSGHINLADKDLDSLIKILKFEAKILDPTIKSTEDTDNFLSDFQSNKEIAKEIEELLKNITFRKGSYNLICIGDIIHDRFSNNKKAMKTLIEKLHNQEVVFIKGNHDLFEECFDLKEPVETRLADYQAGERAFQSLDLNESKQLESKFVNCHYDKNTNKFYIHNGITYNIQDRIYTTAFGNINNDFSGDIAILTQKINETIYRYDDKLTKFRPKDEEITVVNDKCIVVHGHEGHNKIKGKVYNVNARENGFILAVAIMF